jgi:hypothetical protein
LFVANIFNLLFFPLKQVFQKVEPVWGHHYVEISCTKLLHILDILDELVPLRRHIKLIIVKDSPV